MTHRTLHPEGKRQRFEFLAMLVLAVIYRMNEFMGKGVYHRVGAAQCWRDKNMVLLVLGAVAGPALADGAATQPSAREPHRYFYRWDFVTERVE